MKRFLAFDLGAESGRGVLGTYQDGRLSLSEIGRFVTNRGEADLGADGVRRWDLERIWTEMRSMLDATPSLDGVAVDSWGVDFGLLDESGCLLELPVQYRDPSHEVAMKAVLDAVPREEIWGATGIQFMPFNTIYQLAARHRRDPDLLRQADRLLMMPDLLHHRLTQGRSDVVEATNASTTQLLDPVSRRWETGLLDRIGVPWHFLGPIVEAGSVLGETEGGVPVYAPATHDTGSAVAAVPAQSGSRWAFLSSGTWSLLGAELSAPLVTDEALRASYSNEAGVAGTTRFLTNIMGLWLVQECRRSFARGGREYAYEDLTALAEAAPPGGPLVDATSTRFLAPQDMPAEIRNACRESGQSEPDSEGAIVRCCLESLALAYRRKLAALGIILGGRFDAVHIVGGGARNRLLNQWAADACGIPVVAGPAEATAAGNVLAQMVASGVLPGWEAARAVSRSSFNVETFEPDPAAAQRWEELEPRATA